MINALQARKQVPYLRRFARDWATAEIVRLILKNRRDYSKKMDLREDVELEVSGSRIPREDMETGAVGNDDDDDVNGDDEEESNASAQG